MSSLIYWISRVSVPSNQSNTWVPTLFQVLLQRQVYSGEENPVIALREFRIQHDFLNVPCVWEAVEGPSRFVTRNSSKFLTAYKVLILCPHHSKPVHKVNNLPYKAFCFVWVFMGLPKLISSHLFDAQESSRNPYDLKGQIEPHLLRFLRPFTLWPTTWFYK